jgi:hypothetical protein
LKSLALWRKEVCGGEGESSSLKELRRKVVDFSLFLHR